MIVRIRFFIFTKININMIVKIATSHIDTSCLSIK